MLVCQKCHSPCPSQLSIIFQGWFKVFSTRCFGKARRSTATCCPARLSRDGSATLAFVLWQLEKHRNVFNKYTACLMRTWNWKACERSHFSTKILLYPFFRCLFKFSENSFLYFPPHHRPSCSASTPETTITQLSHSQGNWGIVRRISYTKPPSSPSQKQAITLKRKYSRSR